MQENWARLKKLLHEELGWVRHSAPPAASTVRLTHPPRQVPVEPQGSMYGLFHHQQTSDLEALKYGLDHGIGVAPGNMVPFPALCGRRGAAIGACVACDIDSSQFWGGDKANTGLIRIHYGFGRDTVTRIEEVVRAKRQARKAH